MRSLATPSDRGGESNIPVVSCSELMQTSPMPESSRTERFFELLENEETTLSPSPSPEDRVRPLPHSEDLGCNKPPSSWKWTPPMLGAAWQAGTRRKTLSLLFVYVCHNQGGVIHRFHNVAYHSVFESVQC